MAVTPGEPWEIGRELTAAELKLKQVVVIKLPGRNLDITMWVEYIAPELVMFYSGEMNWHVVNFRLPDGSLIDDRGRKVHVHEYLGEI